MGKSSGWRACPRLRASSGTRGTVCAVECHRGTGAAIEAVFKPKIEGDGDGWHRASMEYVAYKLSRMLGMDLVPPAA